MVRFSPGVTLDFAQDNLLTGVYRDGRVIPDRPMDLPEGTRLVITPSFPALDPARLNGHVIIVGFGLAGRAVAELLAGLRIPSTLVESNPVTVETQRALGRHVVLGQANDAQTLMEAGLPKAVILALTIPDEDAVCEAVTLARRLHPEIFIIARTNFSSKGMHVAQLGADEVIKAEQVVALQFYERLSKRLSKLAAKGPS